MKKEQKEFEIIVSPIDVLEREMAQVLGGADDPCRPKCTTNAKLVPTFCPDGFYWDNEIGGCLPLPG